MLGTILLLLSACAGVKVINPNDDFEKNKNTKMLDISGGSLKVVSTYTCKLNSMGNKISVIGKTEDEARKEVIAKCQDRTLISVCKPEEVKCSAN